MNKLSIKDFKIIKDCIDKLIIHYKEQLAIFSSLSLQTSNIEYNKYCINQCNDIIIKIKELEKIQKKLY